MQAVSRSFDTSEKKLYSFEDPDFRLNENQESINLGIIREDNGVNAPSPIQNNTMQEMDSEFLKEYEDAISDRDKKIAELMHEIERMKTDKTPNFMNSSEQKETAIRESRQKIKTNFDLLTKLIKEIEKMLIIRNGGASAESPKFSAGEKNYEKNEIVNVLIETLSTFEQEFSTFFETISPTVLENNDSEPNFKREKNNQAELENVVDFLRKENIEIKYELQNSIQQIQELEIENIGLNDQISTLTKQLNNLKSMQDKISEKEEIYLEKCEKLEKDMKDKEEAHLQEIGSLKEKYNVILEKKQNEIAELNKNRQTMLQFEVKIQDLLKELNGKNNIIGQLNIKNQTLSGQVQKIKKYVVRVYCEKTANLKTELNYMKKRFQEFIFQSFDSMKHNFSVLILKFQEEKKRMQFELESQFTSQISDYEKKLKKCKSRIHALKKELAIANDFKYQPPQEETLNLIHSKLISEIEERKSLYPKDFMKDTNFFRRAFILQDKGIQTEEIYEKQSPSIYLNESLSKFEEQNMFVNKEIALLNNNFSSLEQDYKTFLNLYTQTLHDSSSTNILKDSKMLKIIEKIHSKIEENTKKDEKIHSLITKLNDKTFRMDESRLNKTELEKENSSIEVQKFEQENLFLSRELERFKKKLQYKENELKEKNDVLSRLEKEKKQTVTENKDLQVALHLKNTQYQMILNKTNNSNTNNTNINYGNINHNHSLHVTNEPMSMKNSPANHNRDLAAKRMSLFPPKTNDERGVLHTPKNAVSGNKETLNSIRRIFENKKI